MEIIFSKQYVQEVVPATEYFCYLSFVKGEGGEDVRIYLEMMFSKPIHVVLQDVTFRSVLESGTYTFFYQDGTKFIPEEDELAVLLSLAVGGIQLFKMFTNEEKKNLLIERRCVLPSCVTEVLARQFCGAPSMYPLQ